MLRHICIFMDHHRNYGVHHSACGILSFLYSFLRLHAAGTGPLAELDHLPTYWNFTEIFGEISAALRILPRYAGASRYCSRGRCRGRRAADTSAWTTGPQLDISVGKWFSRHRFLGLLHAFGIRAWGEPRLAVVLANCGRLPEELLDVVFGYVLDDAGLARDPRVFISGPVRAQNAMDEEM